MSNPVKDSTKPDLPVLQQKGETTSDDIHKAQVSKPEVVSNPR